MTTQNAMKARFNKVDFRAYFKTLAPHFRRYWYYYVTPVAVALIFNQYAMIGINVTKSLSEHVFLTVKGNFVPHRGEKMSFVWHGGGPYPKGVIFTKIVRGVPGDRVERQGRDFYINGEWVATAKEYSTTGHPLEVGREGVIPPGEYFVMTHHPDSFDSRYSTVGWIKQEQIVGHAIALFDWDEFSSLFMRRS